MVNVNTETKISSNNSFFDNSRNYSDSRILINHQLIKDRDRFATEEQYTRYLSFISRHSKHGYTLQSARVAALLDIRLEILSKSVSVESNTPPRIDILYKSDQEISGINPMASPVNPTNINPKGKSPMENLSNTGTVTMAAAVTPSTAAEVKTSTVVPTPLHGGTGDLHVSKPTTTPQQPSMVTSTAKSITELLDDFTKIKIEQDLKKNQATSSKTQQLDKQLKNVPKEVKAYIDKLLDEKKNQEKLMRQQELKEMIELIRIFYPEHARYKGGDLQCD